MRKYPPILLLVILILFPLIVRDHYHQHLMILVLMWVVIG